MVKNRKGLITGLKDKEDFLIRKKPLWAYGEEHLFVISDVKNTSNKYYFDVSFKVQLRTHEHECSKTFVFGKEGKAEECLDSFLRTAFPELGVVRRSMVLGRKFYGKIVRNGQYDNIIATRAFVESDDNTCEENITSDELESSNECEEEFEGQEDLEEKEFNLFGGETYEGSYK